MRELRYIELRSSRKMRNTRLGTYTSRLRGPGFDFDEHQPYRPGDDVRRIDWNVTARLDTPYVRHTHADRELTAMIVVDVSGSMGYGTGRYSKRETMMFISASLLFSALADNIRAGFVAFTDRVVVAAPPARGRAAAWAQLEACWAAFDATGGTNIRSAFEYLLTVLKRTAVVCIVSDFLGDDGWTRSPEASMLLARHDVIAVVPEDPGERRLPGGHGYVRIREPETGRHSTVALSGRARARYAADADAHRRRLVETFYDASIGYVFVPTNGSPVEPLMEFFAEMRR